MLRHLAQDERPREKLINRGIEYLSNAELLAILIGTGAKEKSAIDLAHEILSIDESGILFLEGCTPEELSNLKGVGTAKVCKILAAVEIGKRISTIPRKNKIQIGNPDDIVQLFMEKMRYYKKEHFQMLMLNAKGEIIEITDISTGDLCSTVIHPREVFSQAVKRSAASVAFVHNHPSGNPSPSQQDIATTKRLIQAADILGIHVLDHIIIGDGDYISFKNKGLV